MTKAEERSKEFFEKIKEDSHYQIIDEEGTYHLESFIIKAMTEFAKEEVKEAYCIAIREFSGHYRGKTEIENHTIEYLKQRFEQ